MGEGQSQRFDVDVTRLVDVNRDGSRLYGEVDVLGVKHHLLFLRVADVPALGRDRAAKQVGMAAKADDADETDEDLKALGVLQRRPYEVVRVPGREGVYVCYMTPLTGPG